MDAAFNAATFPVSHSCLGIRLEPLGLGHIFTLHRIGNPLVCGQAETIEDVGVAVAVCSLPSKDAMRDVSSWWFPYYVAVLGWRARRRNLGNEIESFFAYWRHNTSRPFVKQPLSEARESLGTPWFWLLFSELRSVFGMTEAEALSYPIARANALTVARAEMLGHVRLMPQDEEDFVAYVKEQEAKRVAS